MMPLQRIHFASLLASLPSLSSVSHQKTDSEELIWYAKSGNFNTDPKTRSWYHSNMGEK